MQQGTLLMGEWLDSLMLETWGGKGVTLQHKGQAYMCATNGRALVLVAGAGSVAAPPDRARAVANLLELPAAVRFISAEPLLGPLELSRWLTGSRTIHVSLSVSGALRNGGNSLDGLCTPTGKPLSRAEAKVELERLRDSGVKVIPATSCDSFDDQQGCLGHPNPKLDWVIVGGESGNGARPFDTAWARDLIEQCRAAGVACFVKQLGKRPDLLLRHSKGSDMAEWPPELRVRQFPEPRA